MILKSHSLTKDFLNGRTKAIKPFDFEIPRHGNITGIVGPDGAGKTTLLRLFTGLLTPTSGELEILGYKMPNTSSEFLQNIGYMPQRFGLYEDLSVYENIELYANLQSIKNTKNRIDELLEYINLKQFSTRKAGALSGGMKQKLALACTLIKKPKLLLLDEPGVGVDPISRNELNDMVLKLADDDISVIWSTSYLEEAELFDDVILLNDGEVLFHSKPSDIEKNLSGRVFLISSNLKNLKAFLTYILEFDDVLDGFIVGHEIRVLLKHSDNALLEKIHSFDASVKITPTKPNFEDGFVDILGVKTEAHSRLAKNISQKNVLEFMPIITEHLTKKFGDFTATNDINIKVKQGEIFGILGPNGAGKSTTFKMLCGLLTPSEGKALIIGDDIQKKASLVKNKIGYMAQKFSLYGNLSLKDNLNFFAGIYGLKGKTKREKIASMVEIFDFSTYLDVKVDDLPLGLKQRLALSCAVMHEPDILFLDEATSGVDPITRKEFWTHINSMAEKGITIVVTTHLMNEAEYCDRLMLVFKGNAIAMGTPNELKAQANNAESMQEAFINLIEEKKDEI